MKPALDPDGELLLHCARLALPAGTRERMRALLGGAIDWPRFMALAGNHGLLPLAYAHLNAIASNLLPRAVLVELWGNHERTARHNRMMADELLAIVGDFDAQGIAAVPYKGPALAESVYGDMAMRQFGDLDILLRPGDVMRAKARLQARGYVPEYPLAPAVEAAFLRSPAQYHLVMTHRERRIMVELHWKTDPDFAVERSDDEGWWAGLGHTPLGNGQVRCFPPSELLLILLLHGSKHRWSSLGWLVDVVELIRSNSPIDWRWVQEKAASLRCERRLAVGLALAHHLLDAPIPAEVLARIDAIPQVRELCLPIVRDCFATEPAESGTFEMLGANLRLYDTARQRLAHCLNTVWSPSLVEWSRWPLPRALFFLYPPMRLARLAWKHLGVLTASPGIPAGATPRTPPPQPHWKD